MQRIADAWAETERTWLANLVPIVRNLYSEVLLLAAENSAPVLEQADRLATATSVETRSSGMIRSEIAAHSLRSRILLRQGDIEGAVEHAGIAVGILDEVGDMPALRSEEVLYHSAVALAAAGTAEEARALLERARQAVGRKADRLTDAAQRERFLSDVTLNRWITEGTDVEC
ncbi:hypothetical protein [Streptomyces sp. NPDC005805]|uniref:hypothetical protein n=1 Tax=Streptomyces sp. NPDC005805 TaxID=3157068 RepID=UPI0033F73BF4